MRFFSFWTQSREKRKYYEEFNIILDISFSHLNLREFYPEEPLQASLKAYIYKHFELRCRYFKEKIFICSKITSNTVSCVLMFVLLNHLVIEPLLLSYGALLLLLNVVLDEVCHQI